MRKATCSHNVLNLSKHLHCVDFKPGRHKSSPEVQPVLSLTDQQGGSVSLPHDVTLVLRTSASFLFLFLFFAALHSNKTCLCFLFQVVAKKYRNYDIPSEMLGVWRYLKNASKRDEFTNTCAADGEIETAYKDVAKRLAK